MSELKAKKYQCQRCGKVFTSLMRVQHHRAAEHAPLTLKDIRTMRDIPRRPAVTLTANPCHKEVT